METKARYFLIGLFTLAGLLGSMGFLLWLAKLEVDLQYAYYDVLFENVTGLGNAGDVRYNGLLIGRVVDLQLDEENPAQVRVRIEVNAETPVKTDTVAVLQGQGVTGVSFVALSGGSADAAPLPQGGVITAEPSAWQSVLEGAPELLQRATNLLEDINAIVDDTNRTAVNEVLENLASASGRLDSALANFDTLSADLSVAAGSISSFATRLDGLADTAEITLDTATQTLTTAQTAIARGEVALTTADETLRTMDGTFAAAQSLIEGDLAEFARQGTAAAANVDATLDTLRSPARAALDATTSTLETAESTLAAAQTVIEGDLAAFARQGASAATRLETTLDTLQAPAQSALDATASALSEAEETFAAAQTLLEGDIAAFARQGTVTATTIDKALTTLQAPARDAFAATAAALGEAEQTFAAANRIIGDDIDPVIADMRAAIQAFTQTALSASDDIEAVGAELLIASQAAASLATTLEGVVEGNRRQLANFLRLGLPEFINLTEEARGLVRTLERFIERVDRDPARYLLGRQGSEFRR